MQLHAVILNDDFIKPVLQYSPTTNLNVLLNMASQ